VAHAGAEEVRKSLLPKLVLEMTLVKMATLPDAAPIDDLIGRLEDMERRLRGVGGDPPTGRGPEGGERRPAATGTPAAAPAARRAATVEAAPGAGRPFTSAGSTAQTNAEGAAAIVVATEAPSVANGDRWQAFVSAAQAKVSLRMCLNGSRPLEEGGDLLHIGVESEFAERALKQGENLALLTELAARCYGGAPRIEVSVTRASAEEVAAARAAETARARDLDARARSSPTVRSALEILGGEITDVRPRPRREP